ncbi:MAG: N-acyl-D-amino-acid deacylase family protein [Rudaea sp.]
MYDILVKNGRVVDGTGSPWFKADVGIKDGRIVRIGQLEDAEARTVVDAQGLTVAPGFIDIHSHADFILPLKHHMDILAPLLEQGITTLVTGNCGLSPMPVNRDRQDLLNGYTAFFHGGPLDWSWQSTGDFLDYVSEVGSGFNMVPLVSHGAIRLAVMGFEPGEPSPEQLTQMQKLAREAMDEGAFGLSAGLIYAPGMYASTEELIGVTEALQPYGGVFTCHVRGSSETGLDATREIIEIGRANQIPVEHSHIEAFGAPNWDHIDPTIELHDRARADGVDITFDVIPYTTANTTLTACFPPYAFEGGIDRFVERLRDPQQREKLRFDVENQVSEWPTWRAGTWPHNLARNTGWKNIWLMWAGSEKNAQYTGKSFEEIGRLEGKSPFDAVADMLIEENGAVLALYIGVSGDLENEEGLKKFLKHPNGAINTDAILTGRGMPHPAAYGSYPHVLGQYVREQRLMPLEEAIRKMTSLSSRRFGLQDRGLIREGMWADLTIFNSETVRDNATYLHPDTSPTGIEYVLINGELAVCQGKMNKGTRAGQVLRRGESH